MKALLKNISIGIWIKKLLPYAILSYLIAKLIERYHNLSGEAVAKVVYMMQYMEYFLYHPWPTFSLKEFLYGVGVAFIIAAYKQSQTWKKKNFRQRGKEYGDARWGTRKEIEPYIDKEFSNNIIFSETEFLTMNCQRMPDPKYNRNQNIEVIGGSGSGKTRFVVKPNLMQLHSSYVVTDPKGTLIKECGRLFKKAKYKIKVVNTINFAESMHYNPFVYIKSEKDILTFATTLVTNLKSKKNDTGDPIWEDSAKLFFQAIIGYIFYACPEEEKNINTLLEIYDACEVREEDETYKNAVDLMFEELEDKLEKKAAEKAQAEREGRIYTDNDVYAQDEHYGRYALREWRKYKKAAGKTAKSILITIGAMMSPFDVDAVREFLRTDDLELDKLGDEKSILFIIISDTNPAFNFIPAIMYTQMFNLLCERADTVYDGHLPVHIRFLLDEFANIGQIPDFEKLIATIRSRNMSATIFLQAASQLKTMYKDAAETITGNCDTVVFLGGKEKTTLKDMEEVLGSETVDLFNETKNWSNQKSFGINYNKIARKLMSMDELAIMPRDHCIVQLAGERPFYSKKYDITKHPRYKYLSDYNFRNKFNTKRFLKESEKKKRLEKEQGILFHENDQVTIIDARKIG